MVACTLNTHQKACFCAVAATQAFDERFGRTPQPVGAAVNDDADHGDEIYDVTPIEWVAWTPFLVFIVVFGVYPQLMFQVIDPAVTDMVARLGETLGP